MAEEKEKQSPEEAMRTVLAEIAAIVVVIFIIISLLVSNGFGGDAEGSMRVTLYGYLEQMGVATLFDQTVTAFVIFSTILSILFIAGIIYTLTKLYHIEKSWHASLYPQPSDETEIEPERPKNERWERVVGHSSSENPSDWRLAILECDIILDELLDKLGYVGGTIGDKLKNVDAAHFRTLDSAWEAHKIRNAIAHEGQDFTLTQREARRIIALYQSVFEEFDFI